METKERYAEFFAKLDALCEEYSMSLRSLGPGGVVFAMAWPVPTTSMDWALMKADMGAIVSREKLLGLLGR